MKRIPSYILLLAGLIFAQGCAVYAVYGVYKTVTEVNTALTQVDSSINRIQRVLNEGKELHRAAEDGKLITTLAEKIPTLIQKEVELAAQEKIRTLSGALRLSSILFTQNAEQENLKGANKAFNDMTTTANEFTNFINELSDTVAPPLK
jgi:ABC-type xylose transport system permease subunit